MVRPTVCVPRLHDALTVLVTEGGGKGKVTATTSREKIIGTETIYEDIPAVIPGEAVAESEQDALLVLQQTGGPSSGRSRHVPDYRRVPGMESAGYRLFYFP